MAEPISTTLLAVKAAALAVTDENIRKRILWTVGLTLSPIILIIIILCSLLSGMANHNNMAVDLCFNGGKISETIPKDYKIYIEDMRNSFTLLDKTIDTLNNQMEDGNSLDSTKVKAVFYSLFFGENSLSKVEHTNFVNCFLTNETRTRILPVKDENGKIINIEETYIVPVPIKDMPVIYENITHSMGINITHENKINATEIYYRVLYGKPAPTYGQEFDDWSNSITTENTPFIGLNGFCSPLGPNWRNMVTSEFGYRKDPITGKRKGHSGIDMGAPKGTPILSALDGTVYVVRYSNSGYGYHLMIDHGGGFITLYAHCSKILVSEGQRVKAGEKIAEVGTTGRSTGNHLHFEVRKNGEKQNPRDYLP